MEKGPLTGWEPHSKLFRNKSNIKVYIIFSKFQFCFMIVSFLSVLSFNKIIDPLTALVLSLTVAIYFVAVVCYF